MNKHLSDQSHLNFWIKTLYRPLNAISKPDIPLCCKDCDELTWLKNEAAKAERSMKDLDNLDSDLPIFIEKIRKKHPEIAKIISHEEVLSSLIQIGRRLEALKK
jgi:hypothetical protein